MDSSQSPTNSEPITNREYWAQVVTGTVYYKQHGAKVVHIGVDGRILCGQKTWFVSGPGALFADLLPDNLCKRCIRVQEKEKYTPKQLGLDLDTQGDD